MERLQQYSTSRPGRVVDSVASTLVTDSSLKVHLLMSKRRATATQSRERNSRTGRHDARAVVPVAPDRVQSLTSIADATVEACCLVAVISSPLYLSPLTSTLVETDKAALLTVLAAIAGGAWATGSVLRGQLVPRIQRSRVLMWLGLAAFATYALATVLSIEPGVSFFGTLRRHEGLLTHAAALVFFVCVATRFRRVDQVERLITVLILGSIPAVAYGILQQVGFDPLPSSGDPSITQWPVRSSFGQHIFFGAYLDLVIAFTAARLFMVWNRPPESTAPSAGDVTTAIGAIGFIGGSFIAFLAIMARLQALAVVFPAVLAGYALLGVLIANLPTSRISRRMQLGGYTALIVLQILALLLTSARGPLIAFVVMAPVFALVLARWLRRDRLFWSLLGLSAAAMLFILVSNIPNGPLEGLRSVHGLNHVTNITESGGNDSSVKGRLLIWQGVSNLMTQHPAIGGAWGGVGRDIVGYGPDTIATAFQAVFPLRLRTLTFEVYNWDRSHDIYLDTLVDAGLLGLGAFLLAVVACFRQLFTVLQRRRDTVVGWLAIGLVAAVAGRLAEGVFGIETAVTLVLFWMVLGLTAAMPLSSDVEKRAHNPRRSRTLLTAVAYWIMVAIASGIVGILPGPRNHPEILASVWMLGTIAGIFAIVPLVRIPSEPAESRNPANKPSRTQRRRMFAVVCALSLVTVAALVSQWEFETAAFAEAAGFQNLVQGQIQSGLSLEQQAAQHWGFEPQYREDLADAFVRLASVAMLSSAPAIQPSAIDVTTVAPATAMSLGRDELFQLSVNALQSARSMTPLDPDVYARLGNTYLEWKRPLQAVRWYQQAERLSANNPRYLDDESLAFLQAHEATKALGYGRAALKLDPAFWYSHYVMANVCHRLHLRAQAREQASLGIFWAPVAYPAPPGNQITDLQRLRQAG